MKILLLSWAFLLPVLGFSQCNALRKTTDKFSGEVRITTDATEPAVMVREIKSGTSTYYLNLTAPGDAASDRKGAILLLDNGTKLDWPEAKVSVSFSALHPRWDNTITARAFVELTADQLESLQKQRITDYKLYVYSWQLKERFGLSLQKQIGCLINADPSTVKEK